MSSVGIKELKQDASRILRRVREHGESFDVTYHGKVIARLVPVEEPDEDPMTIGEIFDAWDELTEDDPDLPIGNYALEAIRKGRGRLE